MASMLEQRKSFRKKLISNRTVAEIKLENYFNSYEQEFLRQKIISPYIVDFLIIDKCLIIELDGSVHNVSRVKEKDYRKDDYFMSMGLFVLRFDNSVPPEEIQNKINQFPIRSYKVIKNVKRHIAKVNGMAYNKTFCKIMMEFSNYHSLNALWKKYKRINYFKNKIDSCSHTHQP